MECGRELQPLCANRALPFPFLPPPPAQNCFIVNPLLGVQLAWTFTPQGNNNGTVAMALSVPTSDGSTWLGLGFQPEFPYGTDDSSFPPPPTPTHLHTDVYPPLHSATTSHLPPVFCCC